MPLLDYQMCDYDTNNMNNTNDVIINRYNSMLADRHVIHYSDGTAVLESADHISRQNCVRTTTVSSAVGGVAANIPDFPDTEDLSAFLKNVSKAFRDWKDKKMLS